MICDPVTQSIKLSAHFGASQAFQGQFLTFRYYIYNVVTRRGSWTVWRTPFWHQRIVAISPYIASTDNWANPNPLNEILWPAPGHYLVYTEYGWFDQGWCYAGTWTTSYTQYGFKACGAPAWSEGTRSGAVAERRRPPLPPARGRVRLS